MLLKQMELNYVIFNRKKKIAVMIIQMKKKAEGSKPELPLSK